LQQFYVGESSDPAQRLLHHHAGHQRHTRRASNWMQVFLKPTASRDEALNIEQAIKKPENNPSPDPKISNQVPASIWQSLFGT